MSRPEARRLGQHALLAALVFLAAVSVRGQNAALRESRAREILPLAFDFKVRPGEIVGNEQVMRTFLTRGTNEFLFILPPGLRAQLSGPRGLLLASNERRYNMRLRILDLGAWDSPASGIEACKKAALAEAANSSKVEEFMTGVLGRQGSGLQLRSTLALIGDQLTKIVWVPCTAGILEFRLTADPAQAKDALAAMDLVLLTFASNEQGKLVIVPRQEQT
jgi:hypothetical protein